MGVWLKTTERERGGVKIKQVKQRERWSKVVQLHDRKGLLDDYKYSKMLHKCCLMVEWLCTLTCIHTSYILLPDICKPLKTTLYWGTLAAHTKFNCALLFTFHSVSVDRTAAWMTKMLEVLLMCVSQYVSLCVCVCVCVWAWASLEMSACWF